MSQSHSDKRLQMLPPSLQLKSSLKRGLSKRFRKAMKKFRRVVT